MQFSHRDINNTDSIQIYHSTASWDFDDCTKSVLEQAAVLFAEEGHCHTVCL
jgi:hypothetical protein